MSAPDTNIEKQKRRHKPTLLGIRAALVFGALMMISLTFYVVVNGGDETADAITNTDQASELSTSTSAVDPAEPGAISSD